MISINVPESEYYDTSTETFITCEATTIKLEHSLVAISKWESKWMKPFLGPGDKTLDEIYYYIECMILNDQKVNSFVIRSLSQQNIDIITNYIQSPNTATTIKQTNSKNNREIITSELIYYWMVANTIPFECQYWHLNRLLMLINICGIKNDPPKKERPRDVLSRNRELNEARKKALKTSG